MELRVHVLGLCIGGWSVVVPPKVKVTDRQTGWIGNRTMGREALVTGQWYGITLPRLLTVLVQDVMLKLLTTCTLMYTIVVVLPRTR